MLNTDFQFRSMIANVEKASTGAQLQNYLAKGIDILKESHAYNVRHQKQYDPVWFEPYDPDPLYPDIPVKPIPIPTVPADQYSQIDQDGNVTM